MSGKAFIRRRVHVRWTPLGWKIDVDGRRLRPTFSTKRMCRRAARAIAEAVQPSELFVHGRSGRIGERATYPRSSDPSSSVG